LAAAGLVALSVTLSVTTGFSGLDSACNATLRRGCSTTRLAAPSVATLLLPGGSAAPSGAAPGERTRSADALEGTLSVPSMLVAIMQLAPPGQMHRVCPPTARRSQPEPTSLSPRG
jgi:hypothetical protein